MIDEVTEKLMGIEASCENCRYDVGGIDNCSNCPDFENLTSGGRPTLRNWGLSRSEETQDE